jgi:hypothetical protein
MNDGLEPGPTFTVLVCRGCCCARGELESSANEQLAVVRAAAAIVPGARVRITDCLGPCSSKNVIAIRHRRLDTPGVRHGTTWLGEFGDDAPLDAIAAWLGDGARREALPSRLEAHRLDESTVAPDELLRVLPRSARQEAASADGRR